MSVQVQLGFTANGASAPFFTLDDDVKGVLDDPRWVLSGEGAEGLVDVSEQVRAYSITRGKSRELEQYSAGQASVEFNNSNRWFDPLFEDSPYFGQIVPKRQVRITVDGVIQFEGFVDDWSIAYDLGGYSSASLTAIDAMTQLSNLELADFAPDAELTGTRINNALTNAGWGLTARDIDPGNQTVVDQIVPDGTGLMDYLRGVAQSEPGEIFISKDGKVRFVDRTAGYSSGGATLGEGGIPFNAVSVVYGSENLYNLVTVSNASSSASALDQDSIDAYGQRDYNLDTIINDDAQLTPMADFLLSQYKDPEYRFEALTFRLNGLSEAQVDILEALELNDVVTVNFTPSGVAPMITKQGRVIGLNHRADPSSHDLTINLQTITTPLFILDDALFGKLDLSVLGY